MSKRRHRALLISLMLALAGCATATGTPVREISIAGRVMSSGEFFNGSFKGSLRSSGTLMLSRAGGATCNGNYSSLGTSNGRGLGKAVLTCDDGRKSELTVIENEQGKLFGTGAFG